MHRPGIAAKGSAPATRTSPPPPMAPYVANGPNGPCIAFGPAGPAPNTTVLAWLQSQHFPPCPAATRPPVAAIDPTTLAISFWRTVRLPVPRPSVPPGYAVTGMPSYLVTNGTLHPAPFRLATPLGELTVTATGQYMVDWGDGTTPTWSGPYNAEGRPYPNGNIAHTYDNTGTVTITLLENWTATWTIGPDGGTLGGLRTTATIPNFRIGQLQAVITG